MHFTSVFILREEIARPVIEMKKSITKVGGMELRLKISENLGYDSCDNVLDHRLKGISRTTRSDRFTSVNNLKLTNSNCGTKGM